MKEKPDWNQTKQQIYKENKSQIDSYVQGMAKHWQDGEKWVGSGVSHFWYESGQFAGKIDNIFLSNISFYEEDQFPTNMIFAPF